jgi:hypothetical protein
VPALNGMAVTKKIKNERNEVIIKTILKNLIALFDSLKGRKYHNVKMKTESKILAKGPPVT